METMGGAASVDAMGQFSKSGRESFAKIIKIAPNEEDTTRQRSWGKNTTGRRYSKYKSC